MKISKLDQGYILRWAKKIRAINFLGGKCKYCGEQNYFVLEFHHVFGKKENWLGTLFGGSRWSVIQKELVKCILVCKNCHMSLHYKKGNILKKKLLEIKKINSCQKCGYNLNTASLNFHHENEKDKEFIVSKGYVENKWKISLEKIILEMNKCMVLCCNCHTLEHVDNVRFNKFQKQILDRAITHKERRVPIDKDQVRLFKNQGLGVCNIAKKLNCAKSTISRLFKMV